MRYATSLMDHRHRPKSKQNQWSLSHVFEHYSRLRHSPPTNEPGVTTTCVYVVKCSVFFSLVFAMLERHCFIRAWTQQKLRIASRTLNVGICIVVGGYPRLWLYARGPSCNPDFGKIHESQSQSNTSRMWKHASIHVVFCGIGSLLKSKYALKAKITLVLS